MQISPFIMDVVYKEQSRLVSECRLHPSLPSSLRLPIGPTPHHCSPPVSFGRRATDHSTVKTSTLCSHWRRKLSFKNPRSQGMSARGNALRSICPTFTFPRPGWAGMTPCLFVSDGTRLLLIRPRTIVACRLVVDALSRYWCQKM